MAYRFSVDELDIVEEQLCVYSEQLMVLGTFHLQEDWTLALFIWVKVPPSYSHRFINDPPVN